MQYTPPYIRDTQRGREEEKQRQTDIETQKLCNALIRAKKSDVARTQNTPSDGVFLSFPFLLHYHVGQPHPSNPPSDLHHHSLRRMGVIWLITPKS